MALVPQVVSNTLASDIILIDILGFDGLKVTIPASASNLDLTTLALDEELAKSHHLANLRDSGVLTVVSSFAPAATNLVDVAIRGMYVSASGTPDLNVNYSAGLITVAGVMKYVPAGLVLATVATGGNEKVGILQINTSGSVTIKYGTQVTAGALTAAYPTPDSGCLMLAKIASAAVPIVNGTTAISNAMLLNVATNR